MSEKKAERTLVAGRKKERNENYHHVQSRAIMEAIISAAKNTRAIINRYGVSAVVVRCETHLLHIVNIKFA